MNQEQEVAEQAGLRYVNDSAHGIRREKKGKSFRYVGPGRQVDSRPENSGPHPGVVIPPAWTDVWICSNPNGHLQVTGRDARGRKQYRYHPRWREIRDENKYEKLISFATRCHGSAGGWQPTCVDEDCLAKRSWRPSSSFSKRRWSAWETTNMQRATTRSA